MFALCLEKINIEIQSLFYILIKFTSIISYTLHCFQKHIPDCPTLFLTFLPAISKSGTIGKIPLNYTFFIDTRYTQQRKNGLN